MANVLPVSNAPSSSFQTSLGGEVYKVSTKWVSRNESWYVSITLLDGEEIILNEKLSYGQSIVNYNKDLFSHGQLYLLTFGDDLEVTFDNFGEDFHLYYFSNEELKYYPFTSFKEEFFIV